MNLRPEIVREHYFAPRQQSERMRNLPLMRSKRIKSALDWAKEIGAFLAFLGFVYFAFRIAEALCHG